jgi:hypothetical protein
LEGSVEGKPLVVLQILTRGGAVAARVAHNHEVRGSSPLPATMKNDSSKDGSFFMVVGLFLNIFSTPIL